MENETTILRQEVQRLQSTIDALLHANLLLRNSNASLLQEVEQLKANTANNRSVSKHTETNIDAYRPDDGKTKVDNATDRPVGDIKKVPDATDRYDDSNSKVADATVRSDDGNTEVSNATDRPVGASTELKESVLGPVALNRENHLRLFRLLYSKKIMTRNQTGCERLALLLIYFHNGGGGSYPEIRKLTNHTYSGLGKFMGIIRRDGWVVRSGWQKYAVTEKGMAALREAFGGQG